MHDSAEPHRRGEQVQQVARERDAAEVGAERVAAAGDRGQRQHRCRAGAFGRPPRGQHHRRQQHRRDGQARVPGEIREEIGVERVAAEATPGVGHIGQRRQQREHHRHATDRDRDSPLPAGYVATAVVGNEPAGGLAPGREQRAAEDAPAEQDQGAVERRVQQRAQPAAAGERPGRRGLGRACHGGAHPERVRALGRVPVVGGDRVPPQLVDPAPETVKRPQDESRRAVIGDRRGHGDAAGCGQFQRAERSIERFAERGRDRRRRGGESRPWGRARRDQERVRGRRRRDDQQADQQDGKGAQRGHVTARSAFPASPRHDGRARCNRTCMCRP